LRVPGFLAAYEETPDEPPREAGIAREPEAGALPPLRLDQALALVKVETERRLTEPPPRFTEASLVKELERCGIGRPSTYAAILATLGARDYVTKQKGRLAPTALGFSVVDLLVERFPELMSTRYTAAMEDDLDAIEDGRQTLLGALTAFWRGFEAALAAARRAPRRSRAAEGRAGSPASEPGRCPDCGAPLAQRTGRYGAFLGCSRYPACRHIAKKQAKTAGVTCPICNEGVVVERQVAGGRVFYGCSRYPACRFTSPYRPLAESCPECGRAYMFEKQTKRDGRVVFCGNESCHFHRTE
jgi:DNA topoisomerase-1